MTEVYIVKHYGFNNGIYYCNIEHVSLDHQEASVEYNKLRDQLREQWVKDSDLEDDEQDDGSFGEWDAFLTMFCDDLNEQENKITRSSIDGLYVDTYELYCWNKKTKENG